MSRRLLAAAAAAAATAGARTRLGAQPPGGPQRWTRTNHRGEPVSMLEGPAVAAGVVAGALLSGGRPQHVAAVAAAAGAGAAFGIVDDLAEDRGAVRKGLRGHLGALSRGELTTGGLKVLGIGAGALVSAVLATPRHRADGSARSAVGWAADVAVSGALVAASANLVNLLDLRPGRALKAVSIVSAPLVLAGTAAGSTHAARAGAGAAGAVLGASGAALRADLAEADMLGDGGANALGAAVGAALVLAAPRRVRLAALAAAVALTVASERVSFTRVIERTPVLREIDAWGRRPTSS
jgi:UDP-N-acetylmuramyl pentapeptide phosphotransferase/UDP-N-acetylglucosamine-1-phosphate transferase